MWNIRQEFEQKNNELLRQYQTGEIEEALWKQEKTLNEKYLEAASQGLAGLLCKGRCFTQ